MLWLIFAVPALLLLLGCAIGVLIGGMHALIGMMIGFAAVFLMMRWD